MTVVTDTNGNTLKSTDVIRWAYLARMTERRGHSDAARRWQAKVDVWLAWQADISGQSVTGVPDAGSDQPTTSCPGPGTGGSWGVH